jgi:hypothetical protein
LYTSVGNPISGRTKLVSDLFILANIEEDGKIIAQFKIDPDTYKWRFVKVIGILIIINLGNLLQLKDS